MAELITLARPYAKAAFEFALASNNLGSWQSALSQAAAVASDPQVAKLLASPNLVAAEKGNQFVELLGDAVDANQANFIRVLAEYARLGLLAEVKTLFELYKANQERTVDVEVQTAFEMSAEQQQVLASTLKEKLARDVELSVSVDESLIGGALVRAGDTVIDGSAKGRLAKLAQAMNA